MFEMSVELADSFLFLWCASGVRRRGVVTGRSCFGNAVEEGRSSSWTDSAAATDTGLRSWCHWRWWGSPRLWCACHDCMCSSTLLSSTTWPGFANRIACVVVRCWDVFFTSVCVCVMRYHVVYQLCLGRVVRYRDVIGIIIIVFPSFKSRRRELRMPRAQEVERATSRPFWSREGSTSEAVCFSLMKRGIGDIVLQVVVVDTGSVKLGFCSNRY